MHAAWMFILKFIYIVEDTLRIGFLRVQKNQNRVILTKGGRDDLKNHLETRVGLQNGVWNTCGDTK